MMHDHCIEMKSSAFKPKEYRKSRAVTTSSSDTPERTLGSLGSLEDR